MTSEGVADVKKSLSNLTTIILFGLLNKDDTFRVAVLHACFKAAAEINSLDPQSRISLQRINIATIILCKYKASREEISKGLANFSKLTSLFITSETIVQGAFYKVEKAVSTEAMFSGDLVEVKELFLDGANINNALGPGGVTPLIYAAKIGASSSMLTALKWLGSEVQKLDGSGDSALDKAVAEEQWNTVEHLLSLEYIPCKEIHRRKLLDWCVKYDKEEVWKAMKRRGLIWVDPSTPNGLPPSTWTGEREAYLQQTLSADRP
jgi:hypothetical protein